MTGDPISLNLRVAVSNLCHLLAGRPLVDRFARCIFPTCGCTVTCHQKDR